MTGSRWVEHTTCHHDTYHLSCEEYERLLERAGGHCEICGVASDCTTAGRLGIDHDHTRGNGYDYVRGILCGKCNSGLRYVDAGQLEATDDQQRYLDKAWHLSRIEKAISVRRSQPRFFRMPDERWAAAEEAATAMGTERSVLINAYLAWLTREPGHKPLKRPSTE